ncbi:hypothetical protein CDQ84_08690 [Clostridium thermosuccinogenes]|uniref:ABC transmembrane type-1 domain-containing protein n=1 Tax=Clostridium thermosuccinogenes TaxID=84032 RepID=A0A2K2FF08_9CLOT|nr:ABC transporter permease subunit [Pseudoclostridium thermosuccinogenes]AUS97631.1 hypothetical protein CDO33_14990 [Pseudoclostridium thermosuccinogenes]PNT97346.1 hypothetical protein CDQ85_08540 [Pseudoclostridium thermosuccinogenes]PNT99282.1 hypothetical protein CDQ84_08690 [Pseudoclostridium thermosuccinogenes]
MPVALSIRKEKARKRSVLIKKYKPLYAILSVILVYFIIFRYIPIIMGVILSLQDFKLGNTLLSAKFVGLDNFTRVFTDPDILKIIRNTILLSIYKLIWGFFPPIILAIMIFDIVSVTYKRVCQTIVYIPHFFSWVIVYGIAYAFFSNSGFINSLLSILGMKHIDFLTNSRYFRSLLVGTSIWKNVGWGTILYFAALTGVNPELYEACKIDGAGPIRRITTVTLPAILPVIVFNLIISLGNILNNDFEQVLLFYNGAVYDVGDIIDTWVYRIGIGQMQYSIGAAVGLMKSFVGFILIVGSNKLSRRLTERSLW